MFLLTPSLSIIPFGYYSLQGRRAPQRESRRFCNPNGLCLTAQGREERATLGG
jgi:hypothetical protein